MINKIFYFKLTDKKPLPSGRGSSQMDDKEFDMDAFICKARIIRIGLIIISLAAIIYYFYESQYLVGSFWILIASLNIILMINDLQKRGKLTFR